MRSLCVRTSLKEETSQEDSSLMNPDLQLGVKVYRTGYSTFNSWKALGMNLEIPGQMTKLEEHWRVLSLPLTRSKESLWRPRMQLRIKQFNFFKFFIIFDQCPWHRILWLCDFTHFTHTSRLEFSLVTLTPWCFDRMTLNLFVDPMDLMALIKQFAIA